jgi:uncharacterized membrane protein YozB (DUF420 family)
VTDALPTVNASLNTLSAVLIVAGWRAIRRGDKRVHARFMIGAVCTSTLFLISYVVYHYTAGTTVYDGSGLVRAFYYLLLFSHIALAAAVVPMVLVTLYRALKGDFVRHRRIARWTLPVWLYVSVTGVVVYLMLYWF